MVCYLPFKLSVIEDGLTAEKGGAIKNVYCGIGTPFTLHLLMMSLHDIYKKISCYNEFY